VQRNASSKTDDRQPQTISSCGGLEFFAIPQRDSTFPTSIFVFFPGFQLKQILLWGAAFYKAFLNFQPKQ
jgi:hypothetical protein